MKVTSRNVTHTIWKFPLENSDEQWIEMPCAAKILHIAIDPKIEKICLWAEVRTTAPKMQVGIRIIGTGHPMPDDAEQFLGTVIEGPYVWHFYRIIRPE